MKLPPGQSRMPLQYLSPTRQEILVELLRRGSSSVEELARALSFTVGAVRQQLLTLYGEGLVTHHPVPHGPGRPRHVYELTPAGQALFRPDYGDTVRRLASKLEDEAPDLMEAFFEREVDRGLQGFERSAADSRPGSADRVGHLVSWLEDKGYLPVAERAPDEGVTITLYNCPMHDFVQSSPRLCRRILDGFQDAMCDFTIERTTWRGDGGSRCVYRLTPAGTSTPRNG